MRVDYLMGRKDLNVCISETLAYSVESRRLKSQALSYCSAPKARKMSSHGKISRMAALLEELLLLLVQPRLLLAAVATLKFR